MGTGGVDGVETGRCGGYGRRAVNVAQEVGVVVLLEVGVEEVVDALAAKRGNGVDKGWPTSRRSSGKWQSSGGRWGRGGLQGLPAVERERERGNQSVNSRVMVRSSVRLGF